MIALILVNIAMTTNVLAVKNPKNISKNPENIGTPNSSGGEELERLTRSESDSQESYDYASEGFEFEASKNDTLKTGGTSTENQENLKPAAGPSNDGNKLKEQKQNEGENLPPKRLNESDKTGVENETETSDLIDIEIPPKKFNELAASVQPEEIVPTVQSEKINEGTGELPKNLGENITPKKSNERTVKPKNSYGEAIPLKQSDEPQKTAGQTNSEDDRTTKSPTSSPTSPPNGGDPKEKPTDDKKKSDTPEFKKYLLWGLFGVCVFGFAVTMFMIITK